ncbi:protein AF-10-like isoform X2 [Artemia franciscana]|uniref:Protein AF-10 n=1 Tax=Artemia franciscana TaxID=6661 RepID=A0AA88KT89_ARTSF|nr:hypothetical protein QYM36_015942 [Artemia franciscana]
MKELIGGCCVCADEQGWNENPLVYCDGSDCNVAVHQACYGIVSVPSGEWFCRRCESQEKSSKVRCELCPSRYGALKRADTGGWAHVICALYIPEVRFGNVSTMEPIIVAHIPPDRFEKKCYICESTGREAKAQSGACMQCNRSGCNRSFHVTCGQMEGLLCEEAGNHGDNVKYNGYCNHHLSKVPVLHRSSSPESSPGKGSPTQFGLTVVKDKKRKSIKRPSSAGSVGSSSSLGKSSSGDLISSSVIVEPSSSASVSVSDLSPPEEKPPIPGGWIPIPEAGGEENSDAPLNIVINNVTSDHSGPVVSNSGETIEVKTEPEQERDVLREAIKEIENEAKKKENKNRKKRAPTPTELITGSANEEVSSESNNNLLQVPQTVRTVSPLIISTAGMVHVTKVSEKHGKLREVDDSPSKKESKKRGRPPKSSKATSPVNGSNYDSEHSSGSDTESNAKKKKKLISDKQSDSLTNGLHTAPHMLGNHLNSSNKFSQLMMDSLKDDVDRRNEEELISTGTTSSAPVPNGVTAPVGAPLVGVPLPGKKSIASIPRGPASNLEELLELQWQQGSNLLMEQAQSFDIADLLSLLHTIRMENTRLEEQFSQLQQRRDHLLSMQARLSLPLQYAPSVLPQSTTPAHQSSSSTRERRHSDYMPPPAHSGPVENGYDSVLRSSSVVVAHERVAASPVIVSGNSGVISNSTSLRHSSHGHYDDRSPINRNLVSPGAAHSASIARSTSNTPEILRSGTPQQAFSSMYQVVSPVGQGPPAAHGASLQSTATGVSVVTNQSQYQQFGRRDIPRGESMPRAHDRRLYLR